MDPKKNMEQIVQESYDATLSPWHGWISSAAFRVRNSHLFISFLC